MTAIADNKVKRKKRPPAFRKVDIVHLLAQRHGYRRYLEVATRTTGHFYGSIDRGRFDVCRRLMYLVPPDYDDGMGIDYRGSDAAAEPLFAAVAEEAQRFDVMLVDPFHGYTESYRDIAMSFDLLAAGGAIVVHDCLPPNEAKAGPDFIPGGWCGVTYKAFLDFVLGRSDLRYFTVDADYGCGVILKQPKRWTERLTAPFDRERRRLIRRWRQLGSDYSAVWPFFAANKADLLRLVSVEAFKADMGA